MNSIIIIVFLLILIFLPFIFKKKEYYETTLRGKHRFNKQQDITDLTITFENDDLKIIDIEPVFFRDKRGLTTLILSGNKLGKGTSLNEDKKTFRELKNLKELNLSNNEIEDLEDNVFRILYNLEILNLANNKLTHLNDNLFRNFGKLKKMFDYLKLLEELHLNGNSIKSITDDNKILPLEQKIFENTKLNNIIIDKAILPLYYESENIKSVKDVLESLGLNYINNNTILVILKMIKI